MKIAEQLKTLGLRREDFKKFTETSANFSKNRVDENRKTKEFNESSQRELNKFIKNKIDDLKVYLTNNLNK
tara:strand:+ start:741 stop:953 length:213 start_codon:yes stop_codon:yes gene_type:complete